MQIILLMNAFRASFDQDLPAMVMMLELQLASQFATPMRFRHSECCRLTSLHSCYLDGLAFLSVSVSSVGELG